jgi:cytochrome c biogenesis protein CcdA
MVQPGGGDEDGQTVGGMFRQLLDDGRAYAQAEFELAKARVQIKAIRYRNAAILAALALFLAFATTVILCLAVVMWFSQLIGPYLGGLTAILVVAGATMLVAMMARKAFDRAAD